MIALVYDVVQTAVEQSLDDPINLIPLEHAKLFVERAEQLGYLKRHTDGRLEGGAVALPMRGGGMIATGEGIRALVVVEKVDHLAGRIYVRGPRPTKIVPIADMIFGKVANARMLLFSEKRRDDLPIINNLNEAIERGTSFFAEGYGSFLIFDLAERRL
jgi:hypothetical protein